ncbi:hypothetical protein AXF42_Ash010551 [Apostasia shenzhenica]|uniref:Uncharacterized protein n=1 Tax=Apostasia shenzhenica TaxID=1088818 RepID=A0A2I0A6E1_9ASPA|nr:hypothetical protein AXF42_Ash010551 [Apostasia shenzhenica]
MPGLHLHQLELHPSTSTYASSPITIYKRNPSDPLTNANPLQLLSLIFHSQERRDRKRGQITAMGDHLGIQDQNRTDLLEAIASPSAESLITGKLNQIESLIGKMNQIDERLTQLEEKQRLPESSFAADPRANCRPQVDGLRDEVRLKETLMGRLQLLETRIRQLNHELNKGSGDGNAMASEPMTSRKEFSDRPAGEKNNKKIKKKMVSSMAVAGKQWKSGVEILQRQRTSYSKKKARRHTQKRAFSCVRSCVFCSTADDDDDDDDECRTPLMADRDCEVWGIHRDCYH